eukprot:scaffold300_cov258-Pinguiococcus_pyrenoidosus.AAC.11
MKYRRRQKEKERLEKEKAKLEKARALEQARKETQLRKYERQAAERAQKLRAHLLHALGQPETAAEVRLQKELLKEIRRQGKEVMMAAEKRQLPVEVVEAEEIAREEVLVKRMNEERRKVREDMQRAEEEYQAEKAREEAERRKKAEAQMERTKVYSATLIQSIYRSMVARKELRHLAYDVYRKHFDPKSGAYYYEDRRTGATQWLKPPSLGGYDVDAKDEWMQITDIEDRVYYFNPKTMQMQWDKPEEVDDLQRHRPVENSTTDVTEEQSLASWASGGTLAAEVAKALEAGTDLNELVTALARRDVSGRRW